MRRRLKPDELERDDEAESWDWTADLPAAPCGSWFRHPGEEEMRCTAHALLDEEHTDAQQPPKTS